MSDEAGFIRAIQENPEDDTVRLVYADWLEEHGQDARARLIRVQCDLAARPEAGPRRAALEEQEAELLGRNGTAWGEDLPGEVRWQRGFPEVFVVRVGEYLRHAKALERLAPVQFVRLYEPREEDRDEDDPGVEDFDFITLARHPLLERWAGLEVAPGFLGLSDGQECFEALMDSPYLTRLRHLSVRGNDCLGESVCAVADPKFAHLTHLDIFNSDSAFGGPSDMGIAAIVTSPHLARLEYLDAGDCDVGDDGLCALATSPHMTRLKTLKMEFNYFTGPGVRALSASECLPRLTHLDLSTCLPRSGPDDPVANLIDAPLLSRLSGLGIAGNCLEDSDLARLAARPDLSNLNSLHIGDSGLSAAGIRALLHSLPRLSHLEWSGARLTEEIASALIAAPQLTVLTVSDADWERPNEETLRRLRDRFIVCLRSE